jgi:hypothetical protein
MCGIDQSVVRVVSVAQILLRTHLHHPVQNKGLNTIHSVRYVWQHCPKNLEMKIMLLELMMYRM